MARIDFGDGTGTYTGTSSDDVFYTGTVAFNTPARPAGTIDGGDGFDTVDVTGVSPTLLGLTKEADGSFDSVLIVGNQQIHLHSIEQILFGDENSLIQVNPDLAGIAIDAGGGADNISIQTSSTVRAGSGDDNIFISGVFGSSLHASVDGGDGFDRLQLNIGFTVDLAAGSATSGGATYALSSIEHVSGTNGSIVYGSDAAEVFDVWYDTSSEGVTFDGRGGDDQLTGSMQNDTLSGGTGNDMVSGGYGADLIYGNQGDDLLYGNQGNDTLYGGQDNDTVYGGQGDDVLHGNLGNDVLEGGVGNDAIFGDDGTDTAAYTAASAGVTVSLLLEGTAQDTVAAGSDTLVSIENLTGSAFADTLTGDANANVLTGGLGNDLLSGGFGNDVLYGNQDSDTLYGNQGNDALYGGQGADTLYGGQNDDLLVGGVGNDVLVGGLGNDTFRFDAGFGLDRLADFGMVAGNSDVIEFTAGTFSSYAQVAAHMTQSGNDVVITLDASDSVTVVNAMVAALTPEHFVFG